MIDGERVLVLVSLLIALAVAGGIIIFVRIMRARCPACRKQTLELDLRDNPGGVVPGAPLARMFRCQTCAAEFRRDDRGPMIPKIAWDAGAREELPRAKVHR